MRQLTLGALLRINGRCCCHLVPPRLAMAYVHPHHHDLRMRAEHVCNVCCLNAIYSTAILQNEQLAAIVHVLFAGHCQPAIAEEALQCLFERGQKWFDITLSDILPSGKTRHTLYKMCKAAVGLLLLQRPACWLLRA